MEVDTKEVVILPEQSKSMDGLLKLFIFTLGLLLFVYSLYLSVVFLDRQALIQNGWSLRLMNYQNFIAAVHVLVLFFLIRLLVQRRRIAIKYVKIAIVVGALFRVVVDPFVTNIVDPGLHVPSFRVWERVLFGVVFPLVWFQYFRKSEDLRRVLIN